MRSNEDHNLYHCKRNDKITIVSLYVDDILITGNDTEFIDRLKSLMMQTFKVTNPGDAKFYFGVEILQEENGTYLHQKGYIQKLLDRFGISHCISTSTPMNPKTKLSKETNSQPVDPKVYQSLVGGLLHATITKGEIQFAVGCVSRFLTHPQMEHKNILRYLKGSLD